MKRIALFSVLIFMLASACKKENRWDCVKGKGPETTQWRDLEEFDAIQVNQKINVEIRSSHVNRVSITTGKNLLSLIKTEVVNGTLFISDGNKCNWSRSYQNEINVLVETNGIDQVTQFGNGKIFSKDTLKADDIVLDLKNSGDIDLIIDANSSHCNIHVSPGDLRVSGRTGVSYIYNSGYGYIYAENLQADVSFVGNHNTGKCFVKAKDLLEVDISYLGNVYYSGTPKVIKEQRTSNGQLIQQ